MNTQSQPHSDGIELSSQGRRTKTFSDSCTECHKAHKSCDKKRPCGRCMKLGIGERCVNRQRKKRVNKKSKWVNIAASVGTLCNV
jgi:hypothetical protein